MAEAEFEGPFVESMETIRDRMFAVIRALYPDPDARPDLREPGLYWDMLSTPAGELALAYHEMNEVLRNAFIQYADVPYLDDLAAHYNVFRLAATNSSGVLRFMGAIGTVVPLGTSVSTEPARVDDPVYSFDTSVEGTLVGLADPATAPLAHSGEGYVTVVTEGVAATTNEVQRITLTQATTGTFTITHGGQTTTAVAADASAAQVRDALVALSNVGGTNEVQQVTVDATGGTFTVTHAGQTTTALAFNVSAAAFTTALDALSNLAPGDVVVTGGPGNSGGTTPYTLTFGGTLAYTNVAQVTCASGSLTGGPATATPSTPTPGVGADVAVTGAGPWTIEFINALAQTNIDTLTVSSTGLAGPVGPISGDVTYKFAYVTNLYLSDSEYGYTLPTPASIARAGLSGAKVDVTIPAITWDPANALTDILEVLVYRSYKSLSDTGFSEFKLVGSLEVTPEAGGVFTDAVTDAEFLLVNEDIEARGGVPGLNSTGVVEVTALSQETGLATAAAAGTIQNINDDIAGVELVVNPEDFAGGSDEEGTEALRERALESVRASAGAGNVDAYITWAKSRDGIYSASVTPEWDGPGTVRVVVAGAANSTITDPAVVEDVRQYIAGDIAILDPTTNPITATTATVDGAIPAGTYKYAYTFVNEGGGQTKPSATVTQIVPAGTATNVVNLAAIPLGPSAVTGPGRCTARRIYRSFSGDVPERLELVTELENNTTTTYVDTEAQGTLPAPAMPSAADILTPHYAPSGNSTSLYNGVAPVGAHVTIETIVPLGVAVTATIVPLAGYAIGGGGTNVNLTTLLNASLEAYLDSLDPGATIRYKAIENAIHDTVGVADFSTVQILVAPYSTPVTANVALGGDEACDYSSVQSVFTEATSV